MKNNLWLQSSRGNEKPCNKSNHNLSYGWTTVYKRTSNVLKTFDELMKLVCYGSAKI